MDRILMLITLALSESILGNRVTLDKNAVWPNMPDDSREKSFVTIDKRDVWKNK